VQALAFELGYADQAHFIREFRATLGVTPGAYVKGA
jgi:AraC-like DNA-binding protein